MRGQLTIGGSISPSLRGTVEAFGWAQIIDPMLHGISLGGAVALVSVLIASTGGEVTLIGVLIASIGGVISTLSFVIASVSGVITSVADMVASVCSAISLTPTLVRVR